MRRKARRDLRRMRRHASRTVLAAALFVCIALAIEAFAARDNEWLCDPVYADKAERLQERIAAHSFSDGAPVTVVMFGSSRTSNGLRGADLEGAMTDALHRPSVGFNFGIPSSGPVTQLLCLRRVLNSGIRPNLVLFEIMPPLLAGQLGAPLEHHFFSPERLLPDEANFALAHGYPTALVCQAQLAELFPVYGYRLPLLGRFFPVWSPWNRRCDSSRNSDETGWMRPVYDPVTPEQYRAGADYAGREYAAVLATLSLRGPATEAVAESIEFCHSSHVPIALVLMPEGSEFRAMYPSAALAEVERMMRQWKRDAPVIDARLWLPDSAFSDSHHMVSAGAREFTRRISETVVKLLEPAAQAREN